MLKTIAVFSPYAFLHIMGPWGAHGVHMCHWITPVKQKPRSNLAGFSVVVWQ